MEIPKIVYVHMINHDIHQWTDNKDYFIDYEEYIHRNEFKSIIKLNEELTSENARLLEQLDDYGFVALKNNLPKVMLELKLVELASIKSKWWYKLMTWTW